MRLLLREARLDARRFDLGGLGAALDLRLAELGYSEALFEQADASPWPNRVFEVAEPYPQKYRRIVESEAFGMLAEQFGGFIPPTHLAYAGPVDLALGMWTDD